MKVSKRIINLETESAFAILAKATKLMSEGKDVINLGSVNEASEFLNKKITR